MRSSGPVFCIFFKHANLNCSPPIFGLAEPVGILSRPVVSIGSLEELVLARRRRVGCPGEEVGHGFLAQWRERAGRLEILLKNLNRVDAGDHC